MTYYEQLAEKTLASWRNHYGSSRSFWRMGLVIEMQLREVRLADLMADSPGLVGEWLDQGIDLDLTDMDYESRGKEVCLADVLKELLRERLLKVLSEEAAKMPLRPVVEARFATEG